MNITTLRFGLAFGFGIICSPAFAEDNNKSDRRPAIFEDLIACKAIADAGQRLACYDKNVASIDQAERNEELVVVDRAEIKKTQKGLFGFNVGNISRIFGGSDSAGDVAVSEIDSTIREAHALKYGKWRIILEDGAKWVTTEALSGRSPKTGSAVHVKRGAMGSYIMTFGGSRSVKVQREN